MDDLAVIDQTTEDVAFDDQQEHIDQPDQPEGKQEPQTAEEKVDGRKFNSEWSKQLKEIRELYANDPDKGPKVADMVTKLRDNYARYQALQEVAPKGIDDVRTWKSTIDALGGSEAAAEMMQRVASQEQIDSRIETGDYGVVSELPENLQAGFYKMIPDALSDLQQKDEKAYSAAVMPHFAAALAGTGMGEHLKTMYTKADGNPELQTLIKQQFNWYQNQTKGGGAMPGAGKTVDPQVQRLQQELDKRRQGDDEAFVNGITDTTKKYVAEAFTSNAEVYLKQFSLTDAQKADLMDSFGAKLTEKLGADAAFNKQLAAYKSLKNRSADTVNTYIRSKIDENAKSIIDGLVTNRYGGMRRKAAAPAAGAITTEAGATRVAQAPDQGQWDMVKMEAAGYENTVKKGLFYLQGGRQVQLVRQ